MIRVETNEKENHLAGTYRLLYPPSFPKTSHNETSNRLIILPTTVDLISVE